MFLVHQGKRVPLEGREDVFISGPGEFERFSFVFGRADSKDPKSAVVEVGWGNDWFTNSKYSGAKKFVRVKDYETYLGHYRNENPWIGSVHITLRKGQLMMDGVVPLEAGEGGIFHLRDEDHSPEWVRFGEIVNGKAMRLKLSGEDLWRVIAD